MKNSMDEKSHAYTRQELILKKAFDYSLRFDYDYQEYAERDFVAGAEYVLDLIEKDKLKETK